MSTTRSVRRLNAPRSEVWRALLDPVAVAAWRVPTVMTAPEMTVTFDLSDADGGGTDLVAVHEGVPDVVRAEDNELGWRQSLDKLAVWVERRSS